VNAVRGLLLPGIVVILTALIGVWLSAESRAQAQPPADSIAGAWTLNKDLSDKPQSGRTDENGGRRRGGGGGGGGMGRGGGMRGGGMGRGGMGRGGSPEDAQRMRDAMRDVMNPPDRLTIVQTESMVVITTGDGRVTRLAPDGKKIKDDNTKIERKTKWDAGKLVSEVSGLGSGKITETYAIDREHRQLLVTVAMDNSRMPQPMTQHRVYDADAR
jgi:hypothetical protein